MKLITEATWTRKGNVVITLKEIAQFTESMGKQVPVTQAGRGQVIEIELSDKSIFENDNVEKANEVIYNQLKEKDVDVFQKSFKIL